MKDQVTHATSSPAKPMHKGNIVDQLRAEAQHNTVLNDVCHVFAMRERARQQVTVAALKQTMLREGFNHTDAEYESVLRFLAKLGLGKLDLDPKGRVRSLRDIKITLQSLGLAGASKSETFKTFIPRNRYMSIVSKPEETQPKAEVVATPPPAAPPKERISNVRLTAIINGAPVSFNIADEIEATTLGELLAGLYSEKGHV